MKRLSTVLSAALFVLLPASFALAQSVPAAAPPATAGAGAQGGLEPTSLLKPLGDNGWPTYCGDYTCKRYSSLDLVNQSNVGNLSLAWVSAGLESGSGPTGTGAPAGGRRGGFGFGGGGGTPTIVGGFGTGELNSGGPARFAGSVLEVNGTLYLSAPDNAWAVDAHDGTVLWHFYWKTRGGTHTGNRGMAMWHNNLYFEVADDNLICLDAATGKEKWSVPSASFAGQYFSDSAPLVFGDHLIVGAGNDENAPGFLQSVDPATGKRQWILYSTPMKQGDPGLNTWPSLYAAQHGAGSTWVAGAYDPETHLYVYGTGNPTPAYTTGRGPGTMDNLFTDSLIAVNVDTGKMAWYYQTSPHDMHDWDSTETPIFVDGNFNGQPRKMVLQALRNGYFFVLDRTTGKHLVTSKFGKVVNFAKGVNANGNPIPNMEKAATIPGSIVNGDVTNYPPPAYSPISKLFYVEENNSLRILYLTDADPRGSMGLGGTSGGANFSFGSNIDAIDYNTGKVVWRHPVERNAGLLTTAGNLLFGGDGDYLIALNPETGKTLWHSKIGAEGNAPETYMLDGKQYVLAVAGNQLFAFVLNQPSSVGAPAVASNR